MVFCFTLKAQTFQFPKIDYDDIEIHKDESGIFKKEFKKKGVVVMEAHYPHKGSIQGLCYKSNVVSDSVFILLGDTQGVVQFYRPKKRIITKTWKRGKNKVTFKNYFSNKKLQESYVGIPHLNPRIDSPGCADHYSKIEEYFKYDESGKELVYKNYANGTGRTEQLSANPHTIKVLNNLKKKADEIAIKSYGKKFFKENIRHDYSKSTGYYPQSRVYRRNNGLPNPKLKSEGWFIPNPERVTYADFVYNIVMDDDKYFDIIVIRLDSLGNMVHALDNRYSNKVNMTRGLIKNESKQNFISPKKILELAKKEGLNLDDPDLKINLKWIPTTKNDSYGKVTYQLLSSKYKKKTYGCNLVYYDEWLVDAFSGVFQKDSETQNGECAELDSQRMKEGNKYGFISPFEKEPIIPYEYDLLPRNMSLCMIAKKGAKYGCINHKNELLLSFEYDQIKMVTFAKKRFKGEFVIAQKGIFYGLFNREGKEIFPAKYSKLEKQSEDVIAAYEGETMMMTYNFKTGKKENK